MGRIILAARRAEYGVSASRHAKMDLAEVLHWFSVCHWLGLGMLRQLLSLVILGIEHLDVAN